MTPLPQMRTILTWLEDHDLDPAAECWVLAADTVLPVVGVTWEAGDTCLQTRDVWDRPYTYVELYDRIMFDYSGGGTLRWWNRPQQTYRGSYTVNPARAVFFLFLPTDVQIVDSHQEKMEQRQQQAKELTRIIERAQHGTE